MFGFEKFLKVSLIYVTIVGFQLVMAKTSTVLDEGALPSPGIVEQGPTTAPNDPDGLMVVEDWRNRTAWAAWQYAGYYHGAADHTGRGPHAHVDLRVQRMPFIGGCVKLGVDPTETAIRCQVSAKHWVHYAWFTPGT